MRSKTLQPESTEQADATQTDLVAKKRALMTELASTVSTSQVLERDIERVRKEIVTTGMSYVRLFYQFLFSRQSAVYFIKIWTY